MKKWFVIYCDIYGDGYFFEEFDAEEKALAFIKIQIQEQKKYGEKPNFDSIMLIKGRELSVETTEEDVKVQIKKKKETGLYDSSGNMIFEGDLVSLAGSMTTDNSMGVLPNGWMFDEDDVYPVYWDDEIKAWSLKLGVEPNSEYNVKYVNHALSLLHDRKVKIVREYERR